MEGGWREPSNKPEPRLEGARGSRVDSDAVSVQ
jgi:hypothetical protein